jgi:hypothetical protein
MNSSIEDFMGFDEFVNEYYDSEEPTLQIGDMIEVNEGANAGRYGVIDRIENGEYIVIDEAGEEFRVTEGETWNKIKKAVGDWFSDLFKTDYNTGDTGMNGLIANQALSGILAKGDAGIIDPKQLLAQSDIQKILDGLWNKAGGGRYMNELINVLKIQIQDQITKKSTELTATKEAARKKAAEKAITANLKILRDNANKEGDTGLAYQIAARKADAEDFVAKTDAILTKWLINNKVVTNLAEPIESIDKGVVLADQKSKAASDPNTIKAKIEATKKGGKVEPKTLNDAYGDELAKQITVNDKAAGKTAGAPAGGKEVVALNNLKPKSSVKLVGNSGTVTMTIGQMNKATNELEAQITDSTYPGIKADGKLIYNKAYLNKEFTPEVRNTFKVEGPGKPKTDFVISQLKDVEITAQAAAAPAATKAKTTATASAAPKKDKLLAGAKSVKVENAAKKPAAPEVVAVPAGQK